MSAHGYTERNISERLRTGMTDRELNEIIDWCRKKLANEKRNPCGLTGKRMEGYEQAMKVVMSYLHSRKGGEE